MSNAPKVAWGLSNGAGRDTDGGVFREIFGTRGLQGKTLDRDVYERALKKAGQSAAPHRLLDPAEIAPGSRSPVAPPDAERGAASGSAFNPVFDRFVPGDEDDQEYLLGLVAYALYKSKKREWAKTLWEMHGRPPSPDDVRAYTETWTPKQIEATRKEANQALVAYASDIIQAQRPIILKEALRGNFERDIGTSMVAALIYTVFLIALAFSLRIAGIDLLGIYQNLTAK